MEFTTIEESMQNAKLDLLIDILAWQAVIVNKMIKRESIEKDRSFQEVAEEWSSLKREERKQFMEEIYSKYGPDQSKELGL